MNGPSTARGPSTEDPPVRLERHGRRQAGIVVFLAVSFVALAVAKPWSGPAASTVHASSPGPASPAGATPAASGPGLPDPSPSTTAAPLEGFTTPIPPKETAVWTGLRWRRLAAEDPLRLVITMLRWGRGFVALGWEPGVVSPQRLWTSDDGSRWTPLPLHGPTAFPPGALIRGPIVVIPGGVAAMTQGSATGPDGIVAWVSRDARHWDRLLLPDGIMASGEVPAPVLASGPGGLLIATFEVPREGSGGGTPPPSAPSRVLLATEAGGWRFTGQALLPAGFELTDLRGTPRGYLALGRVPVAGAPDCASTGSTCSAATLWSPDGLHWPNAPTVLPGPGGPHPGVGGAFVFAQVGRDGIVAREAGETRSELWWQSADGRHWTSLPSYSPLGTTDGSCDSIGCYTRPDGGLSDDGRHLVAFRPGPDAAAWDSTDGRTWRRLTMSGDVPTVPDLYSVELPGGLLYSDGSSAWFGQAIVR